MSKTFIALFGLIEEQTKRRIKKVCEEIQEARKDRVNENKDLILSLKSQRKSLVSFVNKIRIMTLKGQLNENTYIQVFEEYKKL